MGESIVEELRRKKEKLEREQAAIEAQLRDAEQEVAAEEARHLVTEVFELTRQIDRLKEQRQTLLDDARHVAPRLGDFTYAAEDYRLTLTWARAQMKQPPLLDRVLEALTRADLHLEPRAPRYRIFKSLHSLGSLHVASRRLGFIIDGPVLDAEILADVAALNSRYPGIATVTMASARKERRIREGVPFRTSDGDYATKIAFGASDTGSLDAVLPLVMRALDHVAAWWESYTPDIESRIFEPWPEAPLPAEPPAVDAPTLDAPAASSAPGESEADEVQSTRH